MRDRLYINESYRDRMLQQMESQNILGFKLCKAIDRFFVAVALGLNNPIDFQGKKDGYFQIHNNVGTYEKALFSSLLLGIKGNQPEIDKYANADINYDHAEKCAESGFLVLKEKLDAANWDEELFEKRLLSELKLLYEKNVNSNL